MKQQNISNYDIVTHPKRHLFSSRCSKSQHSLCSGITKRTETGLCPCDCHDEDSL